MSTLMEEGDEALDGQAQDGVGAVYHPGQEERVGGKPCLPPAALGDRGLGRGWPQGHGKCYEGEPAGRA